MSLEPKRRIPHVRESRPGWPRRSEPEPEPAPVRPSSPPEVWETPFGIERYPGATVLEDWSLTEDDPAGSVRVLVRYAVIRVLLLSEAGLLKGVKLRTERRIAAEHLELLPAQDWERQTLRRLNELCREKPTPQLLSAVNAAGEAAAKRGHSMGGFALYRAAYTLAMEQRVWHEAARAARGITWIALLDEARYSTRLWRRRATVMQKRADREAAELAARRADAPAPDA